jgi:hypothetical protein
MTLIYLPESDESPPPEGFITLDLCASILANVATGRLQEFGDPVTARASIRQIVGDRWVSLEPILNAATHDDAAMWAVLREIKVSLDLLAESVQ